jgi:trehalose 6-phosphate phosphatase
MPGTEQLTAFKRAEGRRGILVDFDGTLSPIVARPELAQIREGAPAALADLAQNYAAVVVISGRTRGELQELVDVPGVRLAGLYGLDAPSALSQEVLDAVRSAAAEVPGARVEPKGGTVAVHYRGSHHPDEAEVRLGELLAPIARDADMDVIGGKRVLELVPAGRPLKDGAVARLVEREKLDAVLYAGDDFADILAFEALDRLAERDGVTTVKVAVRGPEAPAALIAGADVVVNGPAELVQLLRRL